MRLRYFESLILNYRIDRNHFFVKKNSVGGLFCRNTEILMKILRLLSFYSAAFLGMFAPLPAEVTPISEKIPEAKSTLVKCKLDGKNKKPPRYGKFSFEIRDGEYSYNLWVPTGYESESGRRWPCVFIASPQGNADMAGMAEHLKAAGYVVVMLCESKNGDDWVSNSNFLAAHDDVVARLRIAEGLKFATGFSGGSRASSFFVQMRPGFAGLFQQGAGFNGFFDGIPKRNFCIATSIGSNDGICCVEWPTLVASLPRNPWMPIISGQGHEWSSKEVANKAFLFMEATTLADAQPTGDTRAVAKAWLPRHAEVIKNLPDIADKINFAEMTLKAAGKHGFAGDSSIVALKNDLQTWQKTPAAAGELKADKELWRFFSKNLKTQMSGKKRAEEFRVFAKRFPGTVAGKKAEIFAAGCEKFMK